MTDAFFAHVSLFEEGLLTAVRATLGGAQDHGGEGSSEHEGLLRCMGT